MSLEPLFQYLSDLAGFSIDQTRYITLLFSSFPLALVLRFLLHPSHTPIIFRYLFSFSMGVLIGLACFGWEQMAVLFGIIIVSYLLLVLVPPQYTQQYSMVWAMGSISTAHIYRMATDYGGYHLDFTGPLMIMVQKISLVAFALHDGKARQDVQLNQDQREQKLSSTPGPVVYFSYMFNFHSLLAGHSCTMKEYLAFMDGSNVMVTEPSGVKRTEEPSMVYPVLHKLLQSVGSVVMYVWLSAYIDNDDVLDPRHGQPFRILLCYINSLRIRMRFYFIWMLAESINNCAGLGFAGYDKDGRARWDLVTNISIWELETATNFRAFAMHWNAVSARWLRRCVYERAPYFPTLATYTISAWWHGFYPGYYFCFIHLAAGTEAARKMRRLVRPYFQGSAPLRITYDIVTWALTHIYADYGALCVVVMFARTSLTFWSYYYYFPFISSIVIALFFPSGKSQRSKGNVADKVPEESVSSIKPAKKDLKQE